MPDAATPEPMPIKNDQPYIVDLVKADLDAQAADGERKYGTKLQAFNGRNPAMDAYQESLDRVQYDKQLCIEWDALTDLVAELERQLEEASSRAVYAETLAKDAKFDADRLRKMELEARSQRDSALALAKEAVEVLEKITTNAEDILKTRVHDGIYDRVHFVLTCEIDLRAKSARAFLARPEVQALKGGE